MTDFWIFSTCSNTLWIFSFSNRTRMISFALLFFQLLHFPVPHSIHADKKSGNDYCHSHNCSAISSIFFSLVWDFNRCAASVSVGIGEMIVIMFREVDWSVSWSDSASSSVCWHFLLDLLDMNKADIFINYRDSFTDQDDSIFRRVNVAEF